MESHADSGDFFQLLGIGNGQRVASLRRLSCLDDAFGTRFIRVERGSCLLGGESLVPPAEPDFVPWGQGDASHRSDYALSRGSFLVAVVLRDLDTHNGNRKFLPAKHGNAGL